MIQPEDDVEFLDDDSDDDSDAYDSEDPDSNSMPFPSQRRDSYSPHRPCIDEDNPRNDYPEDEYYSASDEETPRKCTISFSDICADGLGFVSRTSICR
jgi:hypothetical protein